MPLFKQQPRAAEDPDTADVDSPTRKRSMFSRRRSTSLDRDGTTNLAADNNNTSPKRHGFFGTGAGRTSLDSSVDRNGPVGRASSVTSGRSGNGSGLFGRGNNNNFNIHKDPTIMAAREKVTIAEHAEADADRALQQARSMVREAKDHVRFLEREAAEEYVPSITDNVIFTEFVAYRAKRAKAKQAVSNDVSRLAAGLGRHGN